MDRIIEELRIYLDQPAKTEKVAEEICTYLGRHVRDITTECNDVILHLVKAYGTRPDLQEEFRYYIALSEGDKNSAKKIPFQLFKLRSQLTDKGGKEKEQIIQAFISDTRNYPLVRDCDVEFLVALIATIGPQAAAKLYFDASLSDKKFGRFLYQYRYPLRNNSSCSEIDDFVIELVKQCMRFTERSESILANNIPLWKIPDEATRIKVFRLVLSENTGCIFEYLDKYGIKDEDTLMELAEHCARKYPNDFCNNHEKFALKKEETRKKIVTILLEQNPSFVSRLLPFGINDRKFLIDCLRIIAYKEVSFDSLLKAIKACGKLDQKELLQLAWLASYRNAFSVDNQKEEFIVLPQDKEANASVQRVSLIVAAYRNKLTWLTTKCENQKPHAGSYVSSELRKRVESQSDDFIKKENQFVLSFIDHLTELRSNPAAKQWLEERQLLDEIFHLHIPELHLPLAAILVEVAENQEAQAAYNALVQGRDLGSKKEELKLAALMAAHLKMQGADISDLQEFISALERKEFRAAERLHPVLLGLQALVTHPTWSESKGLDGRDKAMILIQAFRNPQPASIGPSGRLLKKEPFVSAKQSVENMHWIFCCLLCGVDGPLKQSDVSPKRELSSNIQSILAISESELPHAGDVYFTHFGATRNPTALLVYASKLNECFPDDKKMQQAIRDFFLHVCRGTFQAERYSPDNSEHLVEIHMANRDILQKWQNKLSAPASELTSLPPKDPKQQKLIITDTDDPIELLLAGEVLGSCLRVDGNTDNNIGLLGYLLNGDCRILTVKSSDDAKTPMQARSVLQLALSESNTPVLLRGKIYPEKVDPYIEAAMTGLAIRKAKALGLPLFIDTGTKEGVSGIKLHCEPGWAPYVYVDSAGGEFGSVKSGKYELVRVQPHPSPWTVFHLYE